MKKSRFSPFKAQWLEGKSVYEKKKNALMKKSTEEEIVKVHINDEIMLSM